MSGESSSCDVTRRAFTPKTFSQGERVCSLRFRRLVVVGFYVFFCFSSVVLRRVKAILIKWKWSSELSAMVSYDKKIIRINIFLNSCDSKKIY